MSIVVDSVSKRFGDYVALDDVSLEVRDGSLTALLGPSGGGKSTLLRVIAGLETPDSGTIRVGERVLNDVAIWKRGVGMVFQSYALFPHMSVTQNIGFGLRMQGLRCRDALPLTRRTVSSRRL